MSEHDAIVAAYQKVVDWWSNLELEDEAAALEDFAVRFAYNSGRIENDELTYLVVREVFEKARVSNYTGTLRTLIECGNMRNAWGWVLNHAGDVAPFSGDTLCKLQALLTYGTYDDDRWSRGERPGTYKLAQYTVGISGVGTEPEDVPAEIDELAAEVDEAMEKPNARKRALVIAAYLHAKVVDIHPFSDGNGRTARLLMNWALLSLGHPPIAIAEGDRMAYFGALDAFHDDGELDPLLDFLRVECYRTWQKHVA